MKISIVLQNTPGYSETFFRSKIKGLLENGFEVELLTNADKKKENFPTCVRCISIHSGNKFRFFSKIVRSFFYNIFYFKKSIALYKLNKKDGKSIQYSLKNCLECGLFFDIKTDWLHFGFGTMALRRENIATAINAKLAVSFRGFDIGVYPIKNPNCYRFLWKKASKIHVISDDIAQMVFKNGFADPSKIIKITPAINTNFFKPKTFKDETAVVNIATVARLHWIKGLEYTLEALALLKQRNIDFKYTIIGSGNELERLQFAVYQLNLVDNIIFAGKLEPTQVNEYLQKQDIYLQYSMQEGFCNAVLEAQAIGLICIVSDAEGLAENVLDGKTGFVVPKRDSLSLANKLLEAINLSNEEKLKISKAAVTRVKNEFSIEKQIQEFISFYKSNN